MLASLKFSPEDNLNNQIDRKLKEFISNLKNLVNANYLYLIPIYNIQLERDIIVGYTELIVLSEKYLRNFGKKYKIDTRIYGTQKLWFQLEILKR